LNQMVTKTEIQKANVEYIKSALVKYETYEVCLKKHANELVAAMDNNDFCAIQRIFKECGVPEDQIKPLMKWGLDCWGQHYHMW
jgi:hypothetical protein